MLNDGRTWLRLAAPTDIDAVYAACQDPDMQRWTTIPVPYQREHAEEFVTRMATPDTWAETPYWVITDRPDGSFLGGIDLRPDGSGGAAVGYMIAPAARRQGHGTRALQLACRWGFEVGGLRVIRWYAGVGNHASRAMAEAVGFQVHDEIQRLGLAQRGHLLDAWYGDLLPSDLLASNLPASDLPASDLR
jgi:RimJ/RimL family protein N-acetyltransferase